MKKKTNYKTKRKNQPRVLGDLINVAIVITAVTMFLVFIFIGISTGIERHEIMECKQWVKMQNEIDGFYWTDWQRQQCSHHGFSDADMGN